MEYTVFDLDTEVNSEVTVVGTDGEKVLARKIVNKICSNGDIFSGFVDCMTGDFIHGKRIYKETQEYYEGAFFKGQRHGTGSSTKLDGTGKFLGKFAHDLYYRGTLITNDFTYVGLFEANIFQGKGTLIRANGSVYDGLFDGGKYHGRAKLTDSAGSVYDGGFNNGTKQGHGVMKYHTGAVYSGDWNKDLKDGIGCETSADGKNEYDGEFVDGKRHGKGTLTTPTVVLTGPWRDDKPLDGPGWTVMYPNAGIQYTGDTVGCRPHGAGQFIFMHKEKKVSCVYEGEVVCGLRHGAGCMIAPAKEKSAIWKGDISYPPKFFSTVLIDPESSFLKDGESTSTAEGTLSVTSSDISPIEQLDGDEVPVDEVVGDNSDMKVYDNGDTFQGHIDVFDQRQGFGIFTEAATGLVYSGQWKASKKHGRGTLCQPLSGVQYMGDFVEDIMDGRGTLRLPDGSKYTGDLSDGMMHGHGTFVDTTNETVYTGGFVKSFKHGEGEEKYADNTVFLGSFVHGKRTCSNGRLYCTTKTDRVLLYEGDWLNDSITGEGKRYELTTPCKGNYTGHFVDGMRQGHGTFCGDDNSIYEGDWSNDVPCDGDWVITCPNRSVYYGIATCGNEVPLSNSLLPVSNGFGTHNQPDGTFYSGGFKDGRRHGSGLCVFGSGEQWDGRWDKGEFVKYGRAKP